LNTLADLNLISGLFSIFIIGYLVFIKPAGRLNFLCACIFGTCAVWDFGCFAVYHSQFLNSARLSGDFASIGWICYPVAAFYFCQALAGREKILRNKPLLVVCAGIIGILLYWQISGRLAQPVPTTFGWTFLWTVTPYSYLYFFYYALVSLFCIYLILGLAGKGRTKREKRQALVLSISGAISLVGGTLVNVVFPATVPPIANVIFTFVWGTGIFISITRYGLMSITLETASDQILSTMHDSLILLDKDGKVKLANQATVELLETPRRELIGVEFKNLVTDEQQATELLETTLYNDFGINHELAYRTRNERKVPIWISASVVRDNMNTAIGFVIVGRDMTERRLMERKIIDLYEKEKAQRLELQEEAETRGLFIDILAHELRTPLTPILVSSALLDEVLNSQPESIPKRLSSNIKNGSQTLAARLEELLDLARYSRGSFNLNIKPTDMNKFFEEVATRFKPTLENPEQFLVLDIPADLSIAYIDPSRLEQVLINLLSNASKYSVDGGRIMLSVKNHHDRILISVKDEGIGISAEDQTNLFKPYHRVQQDRQKYPGLGLGLAVCKQIVEAHRGKIWVTSQPEAGSTFNVEIPVQPEQI
jgi:PAS domain S-box-containing protein